MFLNHFNLEDFSKPVTNNLIVTRKETNILNSICQDPAAKQEMTRHIVNSIKKRDYSYFTTHAHVIWPMECIGFAFSLPIECYPIILTAIEIYKTWLGLAYEGRPECIKDQEPYYQQEIISHFSLLFSERGGDLHKHAELIKEVLIIIKDLCREKELSVETWQHLLTLYLLMTSSVLKSSSLLAKETIPFIFKVLFEIWLRSNTRIVNLWDDLSFHISGWVKHVWTIHHLASVELALTKNIIDFVYGTGNKKVKIVFKALPKPFECDLEIVYVSASQEQVVYFWYRFWKIIEKTALNYMLKESEISVELMKAVSRLIDEVLGFSFSRNSESKIEFDFEESENKSINQLLKVFQEVHLRYSDRKNTVPVPRVNSILDIFGNVLFEFSNDENYEKTRAKAIGAVCRVFSSDLGPVQREYSAIFYSTLYRQIKSESSLVIKKLLKHSTVFFSTDQEGTRLLTDKEGILKLILSQIKDKKTETSTRFHCYSILSTFALCVASDRLDSTKLIQDILLQGIMDETDLKSFNKVVWIACGFISVMSDYTEITQSMILALANRLKNIRDDSMYSDLTSVLSTIPYLIPEKSVKINNFAQKIILKLCGYVKKRLSCHTDIIIGLILTLQKWVKCFYFTLNDSDLRIKLLEMLSCARLSDKCGEISEYFEEFLVCCLGKNYPVLGEKGAIFEISPGLSGNQPADWQHFLVYGSSFISVNGTSDEIITVIRNRIQRTIWKYRPVYSKENKEKMLGFSIEDVVINTHIFQPEDSETDFELTETEKNYQKKINYLMQAQSQTEFKGDYQKKMTENHKKNEFKHYPLAGRTLFSQFGLTDRDLINGTSDLVIENRETINRILEIDQDSANQTIKDLDRFGSKEMYFVSVLFLSSPSSSDYLSSVDSFSPSFQVFLNQLGVKLDNRHSDLGFLSHISVHIDRFSSILYSSDSSHEVISIVPCLSDNQTDVKEIVTNSPVVIIWNNKQDDRFSLFKPSLLNIPELEHKDCVILTPIKSNFVKVSFYPKTGLPGPLINDMIVPLGFAGKLAIYTVINIYGNSLDVVQNRINRKALLGGIEIMAENTTEYSKRLNSLIQYFFIN